MHVELEPSTSVFDMEDSQVDAVNGRFSPTHGFHSPDSNRS